MKTLAKYIAIKAVGIAALNAAIAAENEIIELEQVTVFSERTAIQTPNGTFAAPVSALNYEPQVDVQKRGLTEAQADVTIRGGTFENTGFTVGVLPIYDPQTGHYMAELPISPFMMQAPEVRTGAEQAIAGYGATAGSVVFEWRRLKRSGGGVAAAAGSDDMSTGEVYAAGVAPKKIWGYTIGGDVSVAQSESDGTRKFNDPAPGNIRRDSGTEFGRVNGRIQVSNEVSQTDFFAGYQDKQFAWPNMYAARNKTTPNRQEIEHLKTKLFIANHKTELSEDGDYIQAGAYYRGNDDYYHIPFFGTAADGRHNTVVRGAAVEGRNTVINGTAVRYVGGVIDDKIASATLGPGFGKFRSRTQNYAGIFGEQTIELSERRDIVVTVGTRHDDSNRDSGEWSPVARIELNQPKKSISKIYVSYDETTQLPNYTALNNNPAGLFGGDANLPRSTAQNIELGTEAMAGEWKLSAAVFFRRDNELLDYIFDPSNPASARKATAVDLDTVGVELFVRRKWERFEAICGYTYLDKNDDYTAPNVGSFYALNYAEHRLTFAGIANLGAGFEVRMDNEARHQAENPLRQGGGDKIISSLGLSYKVPQVDGLKLVAQVDNLWNTYYEEVPLVPSGRRSWSIGASYLW